MNTNIFYKNCTQEEKQMFERYFEQKMTHIREALTRVGTTTFDATLERFVKKSAYKVTLKAATTHGSFLASEDDHTIAEALDLARHKLIAQINKALGKEKEHGSDSTHLS